MLRLDLLPGLGKIRQARGTRDSAGAPQPRATRAWRRNKEHCKATVRGGRAMRFRTHVTDVALFSGLVQTLARVSPRCLLQLTPTTLRLICAASAEGVQVWATVPVRALFDEYRIESNNADQITLEVSSESLSRALRSALGAESLLLRLGKRNHDPVLSLGITTATHKGARLEVVQEVLIRILRTSELGAVAEPMCPPPDVYVVLPPLAELRGFAEQLRPLSNTALLEASDAHSSFRLAVQEADVAGDTTWTALERPQLAGTAPARRGVAKYGNGGESTPASVHVSMRALLHVLACSAHAKTTVACICAEHCAIFYVYLQGHVAGGSDAGVLNVRESCTCFARYEADYLVCPCRNGRGRLTAHTTLGRLCTPIFGRKAYRRSWMNPAILKLLNMHVRTLIGPTHSRPK